MSCSTNIQEYGTKDNCKHQYYLYFIGYHRRLRTNKWPNKRLFQNGEWPVKSFDSKLKLEPTIMPILNGPWPNMELKKSNGEMAKWPFGANRHRDRLSGQ